MATIISEEHGLFFVITDDFISEEEPEPLTLAYFKYKEDAEEFIDSENKLNDAAAGMTLCEELCEDLDIDEQDHDYNDDYDHSDEPKGYGASYGCD